MLHKNNLDDTIAAISTPIGKGGIGIIRVSGKNALAIADRVFVPKDGQKPSNYKTYTVHYGWIVKSSRSAVHSPRIRKKKLSTMDYRPATNIIDEVLLTVMRTPRSYTKEDIVEISCHSGIVVLREILDLVLACGVRLAEPGEFTKRAFLNGRIDLSEAEAVADIINAKTNFALESSMKQLQGVLSANIVTLREKLLEVIALLEARIDFPEEGIEGIDKRKIANSLGEVSREIGRLLSSSPHGKVLRDGINAVILGKANVGKSSFLNALLKEERAIVSPIAGTTRDAIEEIIDLQGIPLKIADTAGIIEPQGMIEQEALKRTERYFDKAALVLLMFDAHQKLSAQDKQLIAKAKAKTVIAVLNKSDLAPCIEEAYIQRYFRHVVKVSSLTHKGIKELEEKIVQVVWEGKIGVSDEIIVTNSRHIQALHNAQEALEKAVDSLRSSLSFEFVTEDIKACRTHLGCITGEALEEDILDKIFAEFCIGK